MSELAALHERLRAKYATPVAAEPATPDEIEQARAVPLDEGVMIEVAGRTLLAAPVKPFSLDELPTETAQAWGKLAEANSHMKFVAGRYVEASANRNGAMWTAGDLEFGALGVRGGPLNWLHQTTKVVGTLLDAELVGAPAEAAAVQRPYIATMASLWPWVHPREVSAYVDMAEQGRAYQSMECIAQEVECGSCEARFPHQQILQRPETACTHIRERSATRRMINPSFLGAGTILAPVEPGWASAHVSLMPTATRLAEAASAGHSESLSTSEFELMVAAVLAAF